MSVSTSQRATIAGLAVVSVLILILVRSFLGGGLDSVPAARIEARQALPIDAVPNAELASTLQELNSGRGTAPLASVDALPEGATNSPLSSLECRFVYEDSSPSQAIEARCKRISGAGSPAAWLHPVFDGEWSLSNPDGVIQFTGIEQGTYLIETKLGLPLGELVVVPAGATLVQTITLTSHRVHVLAQKPDGTPVAGASLHVCTSPQGRMVTVAETGSDGRAVLNGLELPAQIAASAARMTPQGLVDIESGRTAEAPQILTLGEGGSGLRARVEDFEGNPCKSAVALLSSVDTNFTLETYSDGRGEFSFEGCNEGTYSLMVRARDGGLSPSITEVNLSWPGPISESIVLYPGASCAGTVYTGGDSATGRVYVSYRGDHWFYDTHDYVKSDGSYALHGLPPGALHLEANGGKLGTATTELLGRAGEVVVWNPSLESQPSIVGFVVDDTDVAVSGAQVIGFGFFEDGRSWSASDDTAADGSFLLIGAPPETACMITVMHNGFSIGMVADAVAEKGPIRIATKAIAEPGVISGLLADISGERVGKARVNLVLETEQSGRTYYPDPATGEFVIHAVPPGRYVIFVDAQGYEMASVVPFSVAAGQRQDIGVVTLEELEVIPGSPVSD